MGKIDTSGKRIIHLYNQAWLEWTLQQHVEIEAELSSEFQFVARSSDSLLRIKSGKNLFLALTELQFQYRKNIPHRLAAYAALAREKYNMEVFVTVIYFLPPPEDVTLDHAFHTDFMGQIAHQDFKIIALWELDAAQVLTFNNPVLLPFVPLMQGGNTIEMVQTCATRIRQQDLSSDLETLLALLSSYVIDSKLINKILRWEMEIVQQSPILQELLLERFLKGQNEGRCQEIIKTLNRMLAFRFGVAMGNFEGYFKKVGLKQLEQLEDAVFTVQTLAEFEQILTSLHPEKRLRSRFGLQRLRSRFGLQSCALESKALALVKKSLSIMQKSNLIHYFLLMVTITLVGCQTNPTITAKGGMSKQTIPSSSKPHTQRSCWKNVSTPIQGSKQQTFILAMGANTGELEMANHDAVQFKTAMQQRYLVPENHICLLTNVYRAEFEQALKDLKPRVKSDDRVIIFFSGHGSFVEDNDDDEKNNDEYDEYDEVFVTLDVKDLEDPSRKNVVADDDFAQLVNALPTERIITFIDACHSGGLYKGKTDDMLSNPMRSKLFFKGKIGTVISSFLSSLFSISSEKTAGGLEHIKGVVLAATQEDNTACENNEGGIFTTTFLTYIQHKPDALFEKLFKYTQTQIQQSKISCDDNKTYQKPDMIGKFLPGD
jgi:predicted transposase YdaD